MLCGQRRKRVGSRSRPTNTSWGEVSFGSIWRRGQPCHCECWRRRTSRSWWLSSMQVPDSGIERNMGDRREAEGEILVVRNVWWCCDVDLVVWEQTEKKLRIREVSTGLPVKKRGETKITCIDISRWLQNISCIITLLVSPITMVFFFYYSSLCSPRWQAYSPFYYTWGRWVHHWQVVPMHEQSGHECQVLPMHECQVSLTHKWHLHLWIIGLTVLIPLITNSDNKTCIDNRYFALKYFTPYYVLL